MMDRESPTLPSSPEGCRVSSPAVFVQVEGSPGPNFKFSDHYINGRGALEKAEADLNCISVPVSNTDLSPISDEVATRPRKWLRNMGT